MSNKSIEELDPNFKTQAADENGLCWLDAGELTLEGIGWPEESEAYCRLPNRAEGVVRDAVWELSRHSAGACVRFVCDSPKIAVRWALRNDSLEMRHMPSSGVSGLDLYARDTYGSWRWGGVAIPAEVKGETALLDLAEGVAREYAIYLPLYNGTKKLEVGVPRGASLKRAPARSTPKTVGFYGTSIVHGGCASRTGMAYPAILGRALDCTTINLGFSGNGKAEPEVATLLSELSVDVWVLDPLPNLDAAMVRERIGCFVQILRKAKPQVPIVLVENIVYQNDWIRGESRSEPKNIALREVYESLLADGENNLHYVRGHGLLGDDGEGTVDGVHPTDTGFLRMAKWLEPAVRSLL